MIDKKTNKQLAKSLKKKARKPSFIARYNRKKLLTKLTEALKEEQVKHLWLHQDFVSAVEKKPKTIVVYAEFDKNALDGIANSVDSRMDEKFPKHKVNVINVNSLLPAIKESIFKELTQVF